MINFEYYNPAKIIFGKGVENGVGREVAKYGKRVLLHYGGGSIKRNGLYDRVVTSLKAEGLYVAELGGVQPIPACRSSAKASKSAGKTGSISSLR